MYDSRKYRPDDEPLIAEFLRSQRHATLLAAAPGLFPQASILPFVFLDNDTVELHAVQADPTFRALEANPNATLLVSDYLAYSPHEWLDPHDQSEATLHFEAVLLHGTATLSVDSQDVADALTRLMDLYGRGPEATPITVDDPLYEKQLRRLGVVRIAVAQRQVKFKAGMGTVEQRFDLARHLRERNEPNDHRAAAVIETVTARWSGLGTERP